MSNLESGEYSLQLVAYGEEGQSVATSPLIRFTISSFEGSLPPDVALANPVSFNAITSTSVIPLSATGNDPDGALVGLQYYLDGVKYGDAIFRKPGSVEESQIYSTLLDLNASTQYYIVDNAGNSSFQVGGKLTWVEYNLYNQSKAESDTFSAEPYIIELDTIHEDRGVRSLFVVGWDNSGNYVSSQVYSISFTKGSAHLLSI